MIKIKFLNEEFMREVEFSIKSSNVVCLKGDVSQNESGFLTFRKNGAPLGDFSSFTTIYRSEGNTVELSNDGSKYVPIPQPTLEEVKAEKYAENDSKAEQAREGQAFTVTIDGVTLSFLTDRKTQQDLQTALTFLQAGMQSYQWIDEQGVSFDFKTPAQIIQVSTVFMEKANVYSTWLTFKNMIDDAETVEEVQQIVIDYGVNE